MKNKVEDIKLFKDILQYDIGFEYYDFHNDYDCIGVENNELNLEIKLKEISSGVIRSLVFSNIEIVYFYLSPEGISNTLENLYRGRFEKKQKLVEYSVGKGFFYLEFSNESKFKFWAETVTIRHGKERK